MNEAGSSQNEMLFMRGNAMSGAPIISGTIQLPKPPIIAGMTMKKIMIRPCAVVNTLNMCEPCSPVKNCMPGCCSSMRMPIDSAPPISAADDGEHQVHRADVLVVGRIDEAAPAGRRVMVVVRVVSRCRSSHDLFPDFFSLPPAIRLRRRDRIVAGALPSIARISSSRPPASRIGLLADHAHFDRHEGVILAAQFRALAVVDALARRLEPGLVEPARDRVDLDAERRHREGVDHVRRRSPARARPCSPARRSGCRRRGAAAAADSASVRSASVSMIEVNSIFSSG